MTCHLFCCGVLDIIKISFLLMTGSWIWEAYSLKRKALRRDEHKIRNFGFYSLMMETRECYTMYEWQKKPNYICWGFAVRGGGVRTALWLDLVQLAWMFLWVRVCQKLYDSVELVWWMMILQCSHSEWECKIGKCFCCSGMELLLLNACDFKVVLFLLLLDARWKSENVLEHAHE